jgi:hypothetical protein
MSRTKAPVNHVVGLECQASPVTGHIRSQIGGENFLYGFKAAWRGRSRRRLGGLAVAPAAAPAPAGQTPVGWREEISQGAAYTRGSHEAAAT